MQFSTPTYIAQESEVEPYKKMGLYMAEHREEVLVENNQEGLERARQGGYAMVLESATAEYTVNQDCSLIIIGDPFRQDLFTMKKSTKHKK